MCRPSAKRFFSNRAAGFTLVESMISISLLAMCGSILLLGVESSLSQTSDVEDRAIAEGLARQLMEEVLGNLYHDTDESPYEVTLGPSTWELGGNGRERFDDIADYHGVSTRPATDLWGVSIGTGNGEGEVRHPDFQVPTAYFANWRQQVSVFYVSDDLPPVRLGTGETSNHREVVVRILRDRPDGTQQELAELHRVVAYFPLPN